MSRADALRRELIEHRSRQASVSLALVHAVVESYMVGDLRMWLYRAKPRQPTTNA